MTNRSYRSRFNKHLEEQSKRNIALAVLGIIVVILLIAKFGIPLLINLSLFLSGSNNQDQKITQEQQQSIYIAPPYLNQTFTATNSAQISLSGNVSGSYTVKLYKNGALVNTQDADQNGQFIFTDVSLKEGQNSFRAKAEKDNKESDYSNTLMITYTKSGPKLTVDSPSSDTTVKDNHFIVSGTTDPSANVMVNDHQAILSADGKFTYSMILQNGDNTIKVTAVDNAGNKTEVTHKVTYSP